jgi:hypothetical protein
MELIVDQQQPVGFGGGVGHGFVPLISRRLEAGPPFDRLRLICHTGGERLPIILFNPIDIFFRGHGFK